jgi:hypothetical protein
MYHVIGNILDTTLAVSDSIPIENQFEFLNNEDSFQQVLSKKKNKKAIVTRKKAYGTRSKVGSSNPCQ